MRVKAAKCGATSRRQMVGGESARTVVGGMLVMLADRGRGSLRWVGMPVSAMMTVRLGFLFLGDSAIGELVEDE